MPKLADGPRPFTGQHTEDLVKYVEKYQPKGQGIFANMATIDAVALLISLGAECGILEEVALAAAEVKNPSPRLAYALNVLHRRTPDEEGHEVPVMVWLWDNPEHCPPGCKGCAKCNVAYVTSEHPTFDAEYAALVWKHGQPTRVERSSQERG